MDATMGQTLSGMPKEAATGRASIMAAAIAAQAAARTAHGMGR